MIGGPGVQLSMEFVGGLKSLSRVLVQGTKVSEQHGTVVHYKMPIVTCTKVPSK